MSHLQTGRLMMPDVLDLEDRFEGVLLGAAYGDALGWPNEERARSKSRAQVSESLELHSWVRRGGGRFQAFEEKIPAGAYSDDTQLTIAVARSRLKTDRWWKHLATIELPFWIAYQQGGGGASTRAARLLSKAVLPWEASETDRKRYFNAGGNGVAMRVAAHCLLGSQAGSFEGVARDVVSDGVLTHGHPTALVGALAFAFALWSSLRLRETLPFGGLVEIVLSGTSEWSLLPPVEDRWPTWHTAISLDGNYREVWSEIVDQQLHYLRRASQGIETGALAFDEEILRSIGCFDKQISGAGTVAAAASIYLASKHAAAPSEGVARAAYARGIDTDTIASMTGAIAGAINGTGWLFGSVDRLQDRELLVRLARKLVFKEFEDQEPHERPVSMTKAATKLVSDLTDGKLEVTLPNGQRAVVLGPGGVESRVTSTAIDSWMLKDEWGQTLIVRRQRRIGPHRSAPESSESKAFFERIDGGQFIAVSLLTNDLRMSRSFYQDLLRLPVIGESSVHIRLGPNLELRHQGESIATTDTGYGSIVYVDVGDIQRCWNAVHDHYPDSVSQIERSSGRPRFVCKDPDGRRVEVVQRNTTPPKSSAS